MALSYRPFEKRTLENLLAASQSGLDPSLGYSIFDDVQQSALDRLAQQRGVRMDRRAVRQDALSGLGQQLTEAALGGVPAEGLEALAGLQATANPMIPQGGLDALVGQASTLSGTVPQPADTGSPLWDNSDEEAVRNFTRMMAERGMSPNEIRQNLQVQFTDETGAVMGLWPLVNSTFEDEYARLRPGWTPGRPVAPSAPGGTFDIGLNESNTRWQDVFGLFPGLFG